MVHTKPKYDTDSEDYESSFKMENSDSEENDEEKYHVPPDSLQLASDDSDVEAEESTRERPGKVTLTMIGEWEKELNANKRSMKPVASIAHAFHGCLVLISGDNSVTNVKSYRVDGSSIFNGIIRLCVSSLYPYLRKVMNLPPVSATKAHVQNSKRWSASKNIIRLYISDLVKLMGNVTSEDILRVLLKHLHQMIPFAACLPTISKQILKLLISLWCSNSDDTVRVIAFLCILRYTVSDLSAYLHTVLKKMYFSYVVNVKFVSQNTISGVNFMRKSLTEMFSLNADIAYNHAFLYLRQLAIHLRSAITFKKKDSIQTVYNWQFISSLRLWVDVLSNMKEKQQLNSLIYPTVQIIIGCIKLIPTAQYLPLRFHCIQMLIKISKETGTFVPVLPFLFEALSLLKLNMQHKKLSMKSIDLTYVLRLSKAQMQEIAFKDAVIENIYDYLLEYTAQESNRISFPDTVVLLQIQLKKFLKDCKNSNYCKKFKPLLEKVEEVSKLIISERPGILLSDIEGIAAWESNKKLKLNTLIKFYESWRKMHEQKIIRKAVDKIEIFEHHLPELKKLPKKNKDRKKSESKERVILFSSDNEQENENDSLVEKFILEKENSTLNKGNEKMKKIEQISKGSKRKVEKTEWKSQSQPDLKKLKFEEIETYKKDIVKDLDLSEFL